MNDPNAPITVEEFEKIQIQIAEIDLRTISIEMIMDIIRPVLNGIPLACQYTAVNLGLYRAIAWSDKPALFDDITYPPIKFAKINRASLEGEQVFYSSSSKNITLFEVDAKVGSRYVISEWRTTQQLMLPLLGYTTQNLEHLGGGREDKFEEFDYSKIQYANSIEHLKNILNYLCKLFCQQVPSNSQHLFKITIAIAKLIYQQEFAGFPPNQSGIFNGLIYPSIKGKGTHDNYAIKKEVIDSGFVEFFSAEFIEIMSFANGVYRYKILDYANSIKDGEILWKNTEQTWTIEDNQDTYFDEDGLRLYDSEQNEINCD